MKTKRLAPPDGGWGWFIMIAFAIFNFIYMPILQNFGLVFKDTFKEMGFSGTDSSVIINANLAVCMFMGLANGPLLRRYSCRKVSVASAGFIGIGLIATAYTRSFVGLTITYGFIMSIGLGMGMCSYPLALNSYFIKNRSKATGFALTITGLGSIIMPQIITALINSYGMEGALLIIAGMSLNTFVSAVLLQPVEWHMIEDTSVISINNFTDPEAASSKNQTADLTLIELENITNKSEPETDKLTQAPNRFIQALKTSFATFIEIFDLSLLKDLQYSMLLLGLAFTLFSESNFSFLTPFILSDLGLSTMEIATFISVMSAVDLALRFVAPFIGDFFKLSARVLFIISLIVLSTTRFAILYFTSFEILLAISVVLGIGKGVRTVYWSLILPEYLPIDRLSSALSLEMVVNGIVVLAGGPLLGVIRDVTGSYAKSIYVMNFLTIVTVLMWTSEMLYRKLRSDNAVASQPI